MLEWEAFTMVAMSCMVLTESSISNANRGIRTDQPLCPDLDFKDFKNSSTLNSDAFNEQGYLQDSNGVYSIVLVYIILRFHAYF